MSEHISVLLPETLELLDIKEDGIYVDLTLGRGGTSGEILKRIPKGKLYSFDLDAEAIAESEKHLRSIGNNFEIIHSNFRFFKEELNKRGVTSIDGLTIDLGVSSPQFDEAERGFSYRFDGPLDMRMDQTNPLSADTIVNTYDIGELTKIFREYGEERDAYPIAKAIVKKRLSAPITTTGELVEIIKSAKPKSSLSKKGHPAKQVFQALRIATNDELGNLQAVLDDIESILAPGGRAAIISFHSLEDRMVKEKFRDLTSPKGNDDPFLKPEEIQEADYLLLTKKPIVAGEAELENNHRAKSAKLRAIARKEN